MYYRLCTSGDIFLARYAVSAPISVGLTDLSVEGVSAVDHGESWANGSGHDTLHHHSFGMLFIVSKHVSIFLHEEFEH